MFLWALRVFPGGNQVDGLPPAPSQIALDVLGFTKAALRVPLAVTRLTVYRQLHMVRSTLLQVTGDRQTA